MKVLITGGAGFLGSHVADHVLNYGGQVLVIDNFATGHPENLTSHTDLTIVKGSIADTELVDRLFDGFQPTHVIHAAASYKDPNNWEEDTITNVLGTVNIVKASQRLHVKRFVYLQTALCYGKPMERPISLSHPIAPFISYSITKTAGENYLILSCLPYVSLRLANIYGPRLLSGPIPTFYKQLKTKQRIFIVNARRDFIEINDFLKLMNIVLVETDKVGCYNVSSGKEHYIKEIFDRIVKRMGIHTDGPVKVHPSDEDDVDSLLLDSSVTEKTFGWRTTIALEEGIDRLIRWYETHGIIETYTHLHLGKKE